MWGYALPCAESVQSAFAAGDAKYWERRLDVSLVGQNDEVNRIPTEQAGPLRPQRAAAQQLERQLADLVNTAYGLTPEEIDLLWRTAPPRMPVGPPNAG